VQRTNASLHGRNGSERPSSIARACAFAALFALIACRAAHAGFDHRVAVDDSGPWNRNLTKGLEYGLIAGEVAGAVWEGGDTRLGKTFWQAIDASLGGAVAAEAMKRVFSRERPSQTDDPNQWFKGGGHRSFPSGEVTLAASVVGPFVLEYGRDVPAVYALELLPLYDAVARVKQGSHWQTDVIAGWALGTGFAALARLPQTPLVLSVMPHAVFVGLRRSF
jgi:undecaprenyl-diphosphatase